MKVPSNLLSHPLYLKHQEFLKFALVGGFNTLLDILLFGLFANALGLPTVASNIISTTICTCVSFLLNSKFVWKSTRATRETAPKFFIITLFTAWVVQSVVLSLVGNFFPKIWILQNDSIFNYFAKICASATGMIINFFGYRLIFREKKNP